MIQPKPIRKVCRNLVFVALNLENMSQELITKLLGDCVESGYFITPENACVNEAKTIVVGKLPVTLVPTLPEGVLIEQFDSESEAKQFKLNNGFADTGPEQDEEGP
jgi:hypothetical protein